MISFNDSNSWQCEHGGWASHQLCEHWCRASLYSEHNYTRLFVEHSYQTSLGYTFTAQSSKCCLPQGVSPEPAQWSGGSAAQSAAIQLLDAGLGVEHGGGEGAFLVRMRDYM